MIGAIAYRADGSSCRLFMQLKRSTVRAEHFVSFLDHLRRHLGSHFTVIWDRLHGHRSQAVLQWARRHSRCEINFLPAYAPELNPVEALWAWLKGTRLANLCRDELAQLAVEVRRGARNARRRDGLLQAFLRKSGLFL